MIGCLLVLLSLLPTSTTAISCATCWEHTNRKGQTNTTQPCRSPTKQPCDEGYTSCYDLTVEYKARNKGNETVREMGCGDVSCEGYAAQKRLVRCSIAKCNYAVTDDPVCESEVISGGLGASIKLGATTSAVLQLHAIGSLLCVLLPTWI